MRLLLPLALVAVLAGCGTATYPQARFPMRLPSAASTVAPALSVDKISLSLAADHHHVRVVGRAGSLKGAGVWGSPGRYDKPANGEEAIARPDGSFELTLHAHPGESVTLWGFVDQGEQRRYSKPLVLSVPLENPTFASGH